MSTDISNNPINESDILTQDNSGNVLSQNEFTPIPPPSNLQNVFSSIQFPQPTPSRAPTITYSEPDSEPDSVPPPIGDFNKFKYEFFASKRNNLHILAESKECKRLLDLKYNDLVNIINRIQTSVIFTSTVSGFVQATKLQFGFGDIANSIISITIATYISLVLSISKYYGLDELKERIQLLREKYSLLLNEIDFNMDKLGPWSYRNAWLNADTNLKYQQWKKDERLVIENYNNIVTTKKDLTSEYEDIMDTKSRNYYHIENKRLNLKNRENVYNWEKKEDDLEVQIAKDKKARIEASNRDQIDLRRNSIILGTEELDNWSFSDWTDVEA